MRKKTKSDAVKTATRILEKMGIFARKGENLDSDPRYRDQILAARRRLLASLPECVRQVKWALDRADIPFARSLVRPLRGGRFLLSGAAVTLQKLGRDDLVQRAMGYVRLFPRRDPSPEELARLMAQASPRTRKIQ